jgi:predicted nucleotidyltransferase
MYFADLHSLLTFAPNLGIFAPSMGTSFNRRLAEALFTKTQQALLNVLFSNPETAYHFRAIARKAGVGQGTIQRELQRVTQAGIVVRELRDLQPTYRANKDCVIFAELRSIVVKTMGVAAALRNALETLADQIQVAFVFGSMAIAAETVQSDVDVLIIGEISMRDIASTFSNLQGTLGREVNPVIYSPDEYRTRLADGNHFLTALQNEPKIFLIGTQDELNRLGK